MRCFWIDGKDRGTPRASAKVLSRAVEILTSAGSVGGGAVRGAEQGTRRTSVGEAAAIAEALGRSLDELVKVSADATFANRRRWAGLDVLTDPERLLREQVVLVTAAPWLPVGALVCAYSQEWLCSRRYVSGRRRPQCTLLYRNRVEQRAEMDHRVFCVCQRSAGLGFAHVTCGGNTCRHRAGTCGVPYRCPRR